MPQSPENNPFVLETHFDANLPAPSMRPGEDFRDVTIFMAGGFEASPVDINTETVEGMRYIDSRALPDLVEADKLHEAELLARAELPEGVLPETTARYFQNVLRLALNKPTIHLIHLVKSTDEAGNSFYKFGLF